MRSFVGKALTGFHLREDIACCLPGWVFSQSAPLVFICAFIPRR